MFGQSLTLRLLTSTVPVSGANTPTRLVGQQPMRLCMLVVPADANRCVRIAPAPQQLVGAGIFTPTPDALLIHASSYPLLCSLAWWVVTDGPETLTVYQVIREQT